MLPTPEVIGVIVLLILLGLGIGVWLRQRRKNLWQSFAKKHDLNFSIVDDLPVVEGSYLGRHLSLNSNQDSSDDEAGVLEVEMAIELHNAPQQMNVEATPGVLGDLVKVSEGEEVNAEAGSFQREVLVTPKDDADVQKYWTESRQREFLKLINHADCDTIEITDGRLLGEFRSILTTLEQLEKLVHELHQAAENLDQSDIG